MGKKVKIVLACFIAFIVATTIYYVSPLSNTDIDFGKCFPSDTTLVTIGAPAKTLWDQEIYKYHTDNRGRVQWETGDCGSITINGYEKYGFNSQAEDIVSTIRMRFYQDRLTADQIQKVTYEFLPDGAAFGTWRKSSGDREQTIWVTSCVNTANPCHLEIRESPGLEIGTSLFILEISIED